MENLFLKVLWMGGLILAALLFTAGIVVGEHYPAQALNPLGLGL